MATINLGRVGFVLRGDWAAGTYEYLDVVHHTGGSWACSVLSTTEEPSDLASDWQQIATDATAEVVDDASPQLGGDLDTNGHMIHESKGSDIASGSALTIPTDGNYFVVNGTTTITSINTTSYVGTRFVLRFSGALTLTHNATSLILPGGANITTAEGDVAEFVEHSAGNFRCINYSRASTPAYLEQVADDTTPQLGGDLDGQGNSIVNTTIKTVIALTMNVSTHDQLIATLTADASITFTNIPTGSSDWIVEFTSGGFTPTWPAAVVWDGDGTEPTWSSGTDTVYFKTVNGGTTIQAMRTRAGA